MIKNLPKFFPTFYRSSAVVYTFCNSLDKFNNDKIDILKTYLQIIPPHRIYQIKQQKQRTLEKALTSLQKREEENGLFNINQQDLKIVLRQVKRRTNMIPLPYLTRIVELACRQQKSEYKIQLRKAYTKIINSVKNKAEKLSLEELVDMVYRLAKLNRRQYELMKQVEKVIIQDKIKIDFTIIRKILFAYTHLNQGSSILYSHISKTLTIGQHQFRPIQLAQSAYMLSKVSQNAQGGYGVFNIAQKHIQASLPRMSFGQLAKASHYLLTQDLGTNKFQTKLQQAIYNTYPSKDRLKITDLVILLKSTSGYFFKYKENALLSLLKTSTIRMTQFASLEQFQDIIWSWGRLGKGDLQLWQCLQKEITKHINQLNKRQLSFIYYSLCSTDKSSQQLLHRLQQKMLQQDLDNINEHYLIKFLLGMHRKRSYSNNYFLKISQVLTKKIQTLSNSQLLTFIKILNQSDLDYESEEHIGHMIKIIRESITKIQKKLYILNIKQIVEILYLFTKFRIKDGQFLNKCFKNIDNVINIPKSCFIKALFSFTIEQKYEKVLQCVPIVEELLKYGPIGYFFSPYQFPLLAYCLFNLQVNGQNIRIKSELLKDTQKALKQINPIILNPFILKGYNEALRLIQIYNTKQ